MVNKVLDHAEQKVLTSLEAEIASFSQVHEKYDTSFSKIAKQTASSRLKQHPKMATIFLPFEYGYY